MRRLFPMHCTLSLSPCLLHGAFSLPASRAVLDRMPTEFRSNVYLPDSREVSSRTFPRNVLQMNRAERQRSRVGGVVLNGRLLGSRVKSMCRRTSHRSFHGAEQHDCEQSTGMGVKKPANHILQRREGRIPFGCRDQQKPCRTVVRHNRERVVVVPSVQPAGD